jgi:hypothetical protein
MREWLVDAQTRVAERVGDEPEAYALGEQEIELLLALAGTAAHSSGDRTNAPLATFLAGLALGRHGDASLEEIAAAASGTLS